MRELQTRQAVSGRADRWAAVSSDQSAGNTELAGLAHPVGLKFAPFPEVGCAWRDALARPCAHAIAHRTLVVTQQSIDAVEIGQRNRSFGSS